MLHFEIGSKNNGHQFITIYINVLITAQFFSTLLIAIIRIIPERLCDTENWNNDCKKIKIVWSSTFFFCEVFYSFLMWPISTDHRVCS